MLQVNFTLQVMLVKYAEFLGVHFLLDWLQLMIPDPTSQIVDVTAIGLVANFFATNR